MRGEKKNTADAKAKYIYEDGKRYKVYNLEDAPVQQVVSGINREG